MNSDLLLVSHLTVALYVLLITTKSFFLRILPGMSYNSAMTPSLPFLTAFFSPSLLSGRLCMHF